MITQDAVRSFPTDIRQRPCLRFHRRLWKAEPFSPRDLLAPGPVYAGTAFHNRGVWHYVEMSALLRRTLPGLPGFPNESLLEYPTKLKNAVGGLPDVRAVIGYPYLA